MRVATVVALSVLMNQAVASADPTPTNPGAAPLETITGPVAEELQQIQRSLGGSVVEQFPSLKDPGSRPASAPAVASPLAGPHQRHVVDALRMAATQLDDIANRLERLELYSRADALREQAQRLRLDARGMVGAATPSPASQWGDGVRPSSAEPSAPSQPPAPRALEPQPLQPEPQPDDPQPLEPTPSPE